MESEERQQSRTELVRRANAVQFTFFAIVAMVSMLGLLLTMWTVNTKVSSGYIDQISPDLRNFLSAIFAAVLGSSVEALVTLERSVSNHKRLTNWKMQLYLRMLFALPLTIALYLVIRGVILTPEAPGYVLNPYGIAIVFFFVGLFTGSIYAGLSSLAKVLVPGEPKAERQLDQISSALGLTTFDNYNGFVCLTLKDKEGLDIDFSEDREAILRAKEFYELAVWFQPFEPEQGLYEQISITEGMDTQEVEFQLIPDSDSVRVLPNRKTVAFEPEESSPQVMFQFRAPEATDPYELWIQVFQKNRSIQVISAVFLVQRADD
jgi:hypothetical protein